MKIVLDTNVVVSGLLNPEGSPGQILLLVASGAVRLYFDPRILAEYQRVLLRPAFGLKHSSVYALLEQIEKDGHLIVASPVKSILPDAGDQPFLEVALAAKAECLVTGNLKHFPKSCCPNLQIVSPKDFLGYYSKKD